MTGLQSSRLPTNRRQHAASRDHLPRSKQSTASTLSRPRGPSSIHVPWQSTREARADNPRLPSNLREHKVFVFQAIDESTKSSSSKQSTTAQSLRLPSNRRAAFLHQHTERRAATSSRTRERQLAASTADHALTNHTHYVLALPGARSCAHIARTHAPHAHIQTQTRKLCASVTNEFIVSAQWKPKKKKKKKKEEEEPHTHHTNTNYTKRENVRVSRVLQKKCLCVCASNVSVQKKKKKKKKRKCLEVHCCLCSTQSRTNK